MKIDILVSDIKMPGMDGLELLEKVRLNWPLCRVIFLTGHTEFNDVYKAIRYDGVSYILKTEGYETIIKTVEKAVQDITESIKLDELANRARKQLQIAKPILQKEFLTDLLLDELSEELCQETIDEIDIPLNIYCPVFMLTGCIDRLQGKASTGSAKSKYHYSVNVILEQYLQDRILIVYTVLQNNTMVWLMQPRELNNDGVINKYKDGSLDILNRASVFIKENLEAIQNICRETLDITVSFAFSCEPVPWRYVPEKYAYLNQILYFRIGAEREIIITEKTVLNNTSYMSQCLDFDEQQIFLRLDKLRLLRMYLNSGQEEEFLSQFNDIVNFMGRANVSNLCMTMEFYYSISLLFLSYINRMNLAEKLTGYVNLSRLIQHDTAVSWENTIEYFLNLAKEIFRYQREEEEKRGIDVVRYIQSYICENYGGDLSLVKLSEVANLNSSYLSRLFKNVSGVNLSDYIENIRIEKSKSMLEDSEYRIKDVASLVGYSSPKYFASVFRKLTGISPREWRDAKLVEKTIKKTDD
jgi:two-component system response regulator YesN